MKRRVASKTSSDARVTRLGSSLRGGISSKSARDPVKKIVKKRPSRSAALSILGLKKQPESPSEGSTRWSNDEISAIDHVAECQRLHGQLERVLIDHQRQEEEIVALRALARSLKEEVEAIQEQRQLQSSTSSSDKVDQGVPPRSCFASHEVFKLDVQVEELAGENTELRHQLEDSHEELRLARACIADKLPVFKLAAIKANAELRCVKSQLQQERAHSDRLEKQLVRCKARQDDVHVRALPERGNNQEEHDDDPQETETVRREREVFLRQCMRLQDSTPSLSLGRNQKATRPIAVSRIETRKACEANGASSTDWISSTGTDSTVKPNKLIHEDLLGLDFYLNECSLSQGAAPKS